MHQPDTTPRLIQREVVLLVVLAVMASVAFVFTREVARWQDETKLADAREWFGIGQRHLAEDRPSDAVDALRQASRRDRDNRQYALTLARALAADGRPDDARDALLALREVVPDEPDVSIALARLAAARQDVIEAHRFYQNALYGIWPPGRDAERRRLRVELIRLLLQYGEADRALSETVALSTNLGDEAPAHVEAGGLFLAAGDAARALEQFTLAQELSPGAEGALAGAGEAAFTLGDYARARRYFSDAGVLSERVAELADVARRVLEQDPLAPRLTPATRRARLLAAIERTRLRLEACVAQRPPASGALDPLRAEIDRLPSSLDGQAIRDDPDLIARALNTVSRAQRAAVGACGAPATLEDRALMLMAGRHAGPS